MKKLNIKKIIIFLLLFISFFLLKSCNVNASIVQSNRGFYYMTNSSGSFIQQNYITGNNSLTLPNNSRISAWWIDFNSESFSLIPGQTYTAYLYFNINNTDYAWVDNGTNLYFGVNCVDAPDNTSTCTNYLKTYTNASIVSNMILIEFDFIAPTLSEGDIVYIALNNSTSNKYALAYSSGNSVSISFNKLSYDLSSGSITTGEQIIIDGQNKMSEEQKKTNQKLDEVNGNITNDNVNINESSITDNSASVSDSPISDLLILPVKLLTNISNGLQGTCSSFNLGSLFGTDLILPCINLESRLGSFLWGLIDSLFCIFLIYNVGMLSIKIWTDVIMMKDVFSDLYKPSSEKKGGDKK